MNVYVTLSNLKSDESWKKKIPLIDGFGTEGIGSMIQYHLLLFYLSDFTGIPFTYPGSKNFAHHSYTEYSEDNYLDIYELSKETIKVINGVESSLISPKQKTFQDVINFRNQLDAQFFDLLSKVDRNIPPVTNGELERFEDLHKKWVDIKSDYDKVISSVDRINKLIIEKSVPFISGGGN